MPAENDLIEWNIIRDQVQPRYELSLRNITEEELAIVTQVISALQRRRQRPHVSLPLPRKDGQ